MASFGCGARYVRRLTGPRDPRLLWQTSDLLRPRRLLQLGQATVVGPVTVGSREAVRVRLPINRRYGQGPFEGTHYADLDPTSRLPLRFVFELDGQSYSNVLTIRRVRRDALPQRFFSVRSVEGARWAVRPIR